MTDIYQELAGYLDTLPAGYPPAEDGVEVRILEHLFTRQEAEIALHLTLLDEEVRVVAFRARRPVEEVAEVLAAMDRKGLVDCNHVDEDRPRYSISQFVIGFYEGQVNRLDHSLVEMFEAYAPIFFQEGPWQEVPQIRTIPVMEAIPITSEVMPYEHIEKIIRSKKEFAVRNCVCRQEQQLLHKGCDSPMETCIQFDGAARGTVASGKGRSISQDEALEIIHQAQKAGLVLQPANSKDPIFLCACCSCCCGVLRSIKNSPHPSRLVVNPFINRHHPERCTNCGACLNICPMDALYVLDGAISLNQERCIGCGLCVSVCASHAVEIVRKPDAERVHIPANIVETYSRMGLKSGRWNYPGMIGMVLKSYWHRLIAPR